MGSEHGFLVVDFETASTDRASACAVGWALVEGLELTASGYQLIDPGLAEHEWSAFNMAIHGIRPANVRGAPPFAEIWKHLAGLLEDRPFIAHYAQFDLGVIRGECRRAELPLHPFRYACSARLARRAWPTLSSVSLAELADWLDIDLDHHQAQSDAKAAARITIQAIQELQGRNIEDALQKAQLPWGEVRSIVDWSTFRLSTDAKDYEALGVRKGTDPNHPLFGQVVVFTGTLLSMTRQDAQRLVFEAGGEPGKGISRKTTYLVTGEGDPFRSEVGAARSAKSQKAQNLRELGQDIQVIREDDFLRIVYSQ